jgi:hypothetical protein
VDSTLPSGTTRRRVELRITRPLLTWFARPTVTIDGVGQPAQWGVGTWAVPEDTDTVIGVSCYNRAWRWGTATVVVTPADRGFEYRVGVLPLGPGSLRPQPAA